MKKSSAVYLFVACMWVGCGVQSKSEPESTSGSDVDQWSYAVAADYHASSLSENGEPMTFGLCNFADADGASIAQITGQPVHESGCESGVPGPLRAHFRVPIQIVDTVSGQPPVGTELVIFGGSALGIPQHGETILFSHIHEGGENLSFAYIYVSGEPDGFSDARVAESTVIDLPASESALYQGLNDALEDKSLVCSSEDLVRKPSRSEILAAYERNDDDPCGGSVSSDPDLNNHDGT